MVRVSRFEGSLRLGNMSCDQDLHDLDDLHGSFFIFFFSLVLLSQHQKVILWSSVLVRNVALGGRIGLWDDLTAACEHSRYLFLCCLNDTEL